VGKVTITVFWDCEGAILEDAMLNGETFNCDVYNRTFSEFRKRFRQVRFHKNPMEILLQHDSARLETSLKTWEAIT
jgi:Transposase.